MTWQERMEAIVLGCREDGWDSYGAAPVTDAAIVAASELCQSLDVVPTVNGGIMVSLAAEAISVEFDSTGKPCEFFLDSSDV